MPETYLGDCEHAEFRLRGSHDEGYSLYVRGHMDQYGHRSLLYLLATQLDAFPPPADCAMCQKARDELINAHVMARLTK
jgi:hypothetical protein